MGTLLSTRMLKSSQNIPPYSTRVNITSVTLLINYPPNRSFRYLRSHFFRVLRCGSLLIFIFYNMSHGVPSHPIHIKVCLNTSTECASHKSLHLVCPINLSSHSIPSHMTPVLCRRYSLLCTPLFCIGVIACPMLQISTCTSCSCRSLEDRSRLC